MKKLLLFICFVLLLISCKTKQEINRTVTRVESNDIKVKKSTVDSIEMKIIINNRIIKQNPIVSKNKIDLSNIDLFKSLYSNKNPLVTIDSATNTIIESFFDLNDILHQKIRTKPNDVAVTDTTIERLKKRISSSDSSSIKTTLDSVNSEKNTITSNNVSIFKRIGMFINDFIYAIIIITIIIVIFKIRKKIF